MEILGHIAFLLFAVFALYLWPKAKRTRQLNFIENYAFHPSLSRKVKEAYPHLQDEQINLVLKGLKDYFRFCLQAKKRAVAMPSRVVDVAWHEFIIFTRAYADFSQKAIGRFLHHTPTEVMRSPTMAQEGIKRAWRLACAHEGIDPGTPSRLPLLFDLDTRLDIENGFRYSRNCMRDSSRKNGEYCAGHIGCSSGCAGSSGGADDSGGFSGWFGGGGDCSSCGGD